MPFIRWLSFGVIMLVWILFPGILLVPALDPLGLPDMLAGAIMIGSSIIFWRGVRTWPVGRRLTDAVLAFVVSE